MAAEDSSTGPVRVGIIGLGGFAASHHDAVAELERRGVCRLVATCDPGLDRFAARRTELQLEARGVRVYGDYLHMLDAERHALEVVTIPTPVPLHAQMHAACIARNLAVYLEKPPTLDPAELAGMLAAEQHARLRTNVGFNYIIQPERRALKQRLLSGEFGAIQRVSFVGLWPRATSYFTRTFWAGTLMQEGRLVLDSCMGNAMAHHVHDVLHWAGTQGLDSWAELAEVSAELYRVHDIESFDTAFVKATTADGIALRLALSHACAGEERHEERVTCEHGAASCPRGPEWRVEHYGEPAARVAVGQAGVLEANLDAYFAYVRGVASRPVTSLQDARPFVELCGLALLAAQRIHPIPEFARAHTTGAEGEYVAVRELSRVVDRFLADDQFPSQQGVAWGRPGGTANRRDLPHLGEAVAAMVR